MHYDFSQLYSGLGGTDPNCGDPSGDAGRCEQVEWKQLNRDFPPQEAVDAFSLWEDLVALKKWVTSTPLVQDERFFVFFQDAVLGAYDRFQSSKSKAWSKSRNLILLFCSAVLPVLAAYVLQLVSNGEDLLASTGVVGLSVVIAVWLFSQIYSGWQEFNAYRETWVRHSACYGRLRLALSRFLLSPRSSEDYNAFIRGTFCILEQNYEQFVLNLSKKGAVARPKE